MDLSRSLLALADIPTRLLRHIQHTRPDYRAFLFEDLVRRLGDAKPRRILEIGPRDGEDTRRLVTLGAERVVLVDLPAVKPQIEQWLPELRDSPVEIIYANIMYDAVVDQLEPFDIVWCAGVLYHNPEQLRFIRQLYDLLAPGGTLVLESATARRPATRNENCVEIWFPPDKTKSRPYHLAVNVTHLPSIKAIESWLHMIGFTEIERSSCHHRVAWSLAADRAAYLARRPLEDVRSSYYAQYDGGYLVGRAR